MVRAVYNGTAVNRATGAVIPNAEIEVRLPNGSKAAIYDALTGGNALANPFTGQTNGDFSFYIETPARVNIYVAGAGGTRELLDVVLVSEYSLENPMMQPGDMVVGGAGGLPERVAKGATGRILRATANGVEWVSIVDNLTTQESSQPLSAKQGYVLKGLIDTINAVLQSDDGTLDELQEIVDYIKLNREDLENLSIPAIAGLEDALAGKQATITGAASTIVSSNLTPSRVAVVDVNGKMSSSGTISITELNTLDGMDENIKDALAGKLEDGDAVKQVDLSTTYHEYQRRVFALCTLDNSTNLSYAVGRLMLIRPNGLHEPIVADVSIGKKLNIDKPFASLKYISSEATAGSLLGAPVRLCTFTYNGVKYAGIDYYKTAATNPYAWWQGKSTIEPFAVLYYNEQTDTAINEEINNSISFDDFEAITPTVFDSLQVQGNDVLHTGMSATSAEAKAGTAGKYPDAAKVLEAIQQFGLGIDSFSAQITDANALTESRWYCTPATWTGSPRAGTQSANQGVLLHQPSALTNAYATQIWMRAQASEVWFRIKNNNVWSSWDELSKKSDLGDAATKNVGTTAGTVAAGDDPRFNEMAGKGVPPNVQSSNYTLQASDNSKHVKMSSSSLLTLTIPNNTNVPLDVGFAVTLVNVGVYGLTVARQTGVTLSLAGVGVVSGGSTVSLDVGANRPMATLLKIYANDWIITGAGVLIS